MICQSARTGMGTEAVELVMAFEEEFGISIPDSAAEKMVTPRHVVDFVVEARHDVGKLDAQAHVLEVLGQMGYADVNPEMNFNELFRQRGRIRQWKVFCTELSPFSAPPARGSGPGRIIFGIGILGLITGAFLRQGVMVIAGLGMSALGCVISQFCMKIPDSADTLPKLLERFTRPVSRDEVAEKVKRIVLKQLGLPEAAYGEDKRFVEDFGID